MFNEDNIQVKGTLEVIIRDKHGRYSETVTIGRNVIEARSKLVLSRILGSNKKTWDPDNPNNLVSPAWTTFPDERTPGAGPETTNLYWRLLTKSFAPSVGFPYNNDQALFGPSTTHRVMVDGFAFGGVQMTYASMPPLANVNRCYFHPLGETSLSNYSKLLPSIGITGMAFGNGGHLIRNPDDPAGGPYLIKFFKKTSDPLILDMDNTNDDPTLPAQPVGNVPTLEGYLPYGSTNRSIPGTTYEPVENGIVPWRESFALSGILQDNYGDGIGGAGNNFVDEPNSTLYSEVLRLPLDVTNGVTFPTWKSVQFRCTIGGDSEANQIIEYGYANRPRNWITEAGLITGENTLVQSPNPRTDGLVMDTATSGTTNVNGAELLDGAVPEKALDKDYFTKIQPTATYLDANGQLTASGNNTWNLFARRCFGILTKTPDFGFTFVWTIQF